MDPVMWVGFLLLSCILCVSVVSSAPVKHARHHGGFPHGRQNHGANITIARSVIKTTNIDVEGKFTVMSMAMNHHSDSSWSIPSLHDKYSAGWNRTVAGEKMLRPHACSLRFYAMGLEKTMENFMKGGTGYLGIEVTQKSLSGKGRGKTNWYGFDKSDKYKLHCYYMTNKGYGSEFVDDPKTLGVAVYCPVGLDTEIGEYAFRGLMEPGYFCRNFADFSVNAELYLRPSEFKLVGNDQDFLTVAQNASVLHDEVDKAAKAVEKEQIRSDFTTTPFAARTQDIRLSEMLDPRPHSICTVQTFRNAQSGPMLYAFVKYHIDMGWRVIVYDRFGLHLEFLKDIIGIGGLDYYPFTVLQLVNPTKYNQEYAKKQGSDRRVFYKMEKNWGFKGEQADTADQDQDKTKTYDFARIEYAHLDMMLFLDADEFFYCPQATAGGKESQRNYQQKIMQQFSSQGVEEMRFVRIPYSGIAVAPAGFNGTKEELWEVDFTESTEKCMLDAFAKKDASEIMRCWSSASAYDGFPKSADFGGVCPFHYNHWSCDGMRNGGRDYVSTRCRCKVSFDMINGFEYKPVLNKCHLMHYNDNKYKFQARREKHVNDKGSIFEPSPIVPMM